MRLTKIICTVGPACRSLEGAKGLLEGGMSIARLNFSHGSHEEHTENVKTLRKAAKELGQTLAIMMDTKGSEIRTIDRKDKLEIIEGETVIFSPLPLKTKEKLIQVDHPGFVKDAAKAKTILLDNGEIIFEAKKVTKDGIIAIAKSNGSIGSRRHVNIPGVVISLPSITDKDWEDIELGCKLELDFVAISFVRFADDVHAVREFIQKSGKHMEIIAKIENATAVENLAEIIEASDGLMVARGDLGAEIPFEKVPAVQDDIVARCRKASKPVIVATHMLESMIHNPLPTRAEVTDVAHAAATGSDCTMLSGETASGLFPFRALDTMHRVLVETEKARGSSPVSQNNYPSYPQQPHAVSATTMAASLNAKAILVFTSSGGIAKAVSRERPTMPIFAFTDHPEITRSLHMNFGVYPFDMKLKADEKTVLAGIEILKKKNLVSSGDHVVVLSPAAEHDRAVRTVRSMMIP